MACLCTIMSADKNTMSNALVAAQSRLFRTGLYLADEKLCEKVHWVPHGHGHTLALLPQYVPVICDSANKIGSQPTTTTATHNFIGGGTLSPVVEPLQSGSSTNSIVDTDPIDGMLGTPGLAPIIMPCCHCACRQQRLLAVSRWGISRTQPHL